MCFGSMKAWKKSAISPMKSLEIALVTNTVWKKKNKKKKIEYINQQWAGDYMKQSRGDSGRSSAWTSVLS